MNIIEQHAYSNALSHIHPLEKILFSSGLLLITVFVRDLLTSILVIGIISGCILLLAKIPFHNYGMLLLAPVAFLTIGASVMLFAVTFDGTSQLENIIFHFSIGTLSLIMTSTSLETTLTTITTSFAGVSCLYFLILTTPFPDIAKWLVRMKVPSTFVELMTLCYRFLFLFLENAQTIYRAQQSRCGYDSWKSRFRSYGIFISQLFIKTTVRARQLEQGLLSRGYDGEIHLYPLPRSMSRIHTFTIIATFMFVLGQYLVRSYYE